MKFLDLQERIPQNTFTLVDVLKYFPQEHSATLNTQLARFVRKGLVGSIKRGVYYFDAKKIDEFSLSHLLYTPSYISLASALNYYHMIPDIPQAVTAVTVTTTKRITTALGTYSYTKIKKELFFGFSVITAPDKTLYNIAHKEKALLDYFYIHKLRTTDDLRLRLEDFDMKRYHAYVQWYPDWAQAIIL